MHEYEPRHEHEPSMNQRTGKVGYIVLWLLGVPLPLLFLIFLLRGCN